MRKKLILETVLYKPRKNQCIKLKCGREWPWDHTFLPETVISKTPKFHDANPLLLLLKLHPHDNSIMAIKNNRLLEYKTHKENRSMNCTFKESIMENSKTCPINSGYRLLSMLFTLGERLMQNRIHISYKKGICRWCNIVATSDTKFYKDSCKRLL